MGKKATAEYTHKTKQHYPFKPETEILLYYPERHWKLLWGFFATPKCLLQRSLAQNLTEGCRFSLKCETKGLRRCRRREKMSPQAAHGLDHWELALQNKGAQLKLVKCITNKPLSRALDIHGGLCDSEQKQWHQESPVSATSIIQHTLKVTFSYLGSFTEKLSNPSSSPSWSPPQ